jgi:hypothetical protein
MPASEWLQPVKIRVTACLLRLYKKVLFLFFSSVFHSYLVVGFECQLYHPGSGLLYIGQIDKAEGAVTPEVHVRPRL